MTRPEARERERAYMRRGLPFRATHRVSIKNCMSMHSFTPEMWLRFQESTVHLLVDTETIKMADVIHVGVLYTD